MTHHRARLVEWLLILVRGRLQVAEGPVSNQGAHDGRELAAPEGPPGFLIEARRAFAFLAAEGFVEVSSTDTSVTWQGERVVVEVHHDPRGFELGVRLRRRVDEGWMYLGEALRAISPAHGAQASYQTSDPARIGVGLERLAAAVQEHAAALLAGEPEVWDRVLEAVRESRAAYILDMRFHVTRKRADAAWCAKDYPTALDLYREMEEALTTAETRRLGYLERKLSQEPPS